MNIGYTTGVFDLFHVGHLNLLRNAKAMCDMLVVGVTTDELALQSGKSPAIKFDERIEIVRNMKFVDMAIAQSDLNKLSMCKKLGANLMFVGDDWYDTERWKKLETEFSQNNIKIVYFPYTKNNSSTQIKKQIKSSAVVDKNYCMSSFLALRYIDNNDIIFKQGLNRPDCRDKPPSEIWDIKVASDLDTHLRNYVNKNVDEKTAILLSSGIDSAIIASYLKPGTKAYTLRCAVDGALDESQLAASYASYYNLDHTIIDVTWEDYLNILPEIHKYLNAPVHSIAPQIYKALAIAKDEGFNKIISGYGADCTFGGLDRILAKDRNIEEFSQWYTFIDPNIALKNPVNMLHAYLPFADRNGIIDAVGFTHDGALGEEGAISFNCSFDLLEITNLKPFINCNFDLDIERIRSGESKYLLKELFAKKYPEFKIPEKIPFPRAVDIWLKDWKGPVRSEFKKDFIQNFSGDQKWLVFALEHFVNQIN